MQQDGGHAAVDNVLDVVLVELCIALYDNLVTLDRYHFARVFIYEVLNPGLEYAGCEFASYMLTQVGLVDLDLVCQAKDIEDILVGLITDGAQQGGNGQFLLTVDICVHHIVDVCSKFDPASLERDDTCGVELGAVGVQALSKEYTRRAV